MGDLLISTKRHRTMLVGVCDKVAVVLVAIPAPPDLQVSFKPAKSVNSEHTLAVLAGGIVFGSGIGREDWEVYGPPGTPVVEAQPVVNEGTKDISSNTLAAVWRDMRVDSPESDGGVAPLRIVKHLFDHTSEVFEAEVAK